MSYHHSQRVIAHLEPIREAAQPNSIGRVRHNKLTGSTQLVLAHIASAINNETGSFPVSIATIYKRTRLSKNTIQLALQQLCDFGVLERQRNYYRQAFTYSLVLQCPDDCKNLKEHNTPRELSERPTPQDDYTRGDKPTMEQRPNVQVDERPNPQVDSVLATRSLIEIDKKTNKNVDRNTSQHCFSCNGALEVISDKQLIIHQENCKQLSTLRDSQSWIIAANKLGARWQELDTRKQQIHYWSDLAEYKNNQAEKGRRIERETEHKNQKALELMPEGILPNWTKWLTLSYRNGNQIEGQRITLASTKSQAGLDLIPGGDWEKGTYPKPGDWGTTSAAFANT